MKKRVFSLILSVCCLFGTFPLVSASADEEIPKLNGSGIVKTDKYAIGLDLSIWNVGGSKVLDYDSIDFKGLKEKGCDFVILRMGFEGSSSKTDTLDLAFMEYYKRAREAGLKVGIYFFSRATSYDAAKQDAEWVINVIEENQMYFEYPVCYDVEADVHYAMAPANRLKVCFGWCDTMAANGYYPAVYVNKDFYPGVSAEFKGKYDVWYRYLLSDRKGAQYDPKTTNISDKASLWQYNLYAEYGDSINITYTQNQLDGNVSYKDYESIMRENGYNNMDVATPPATESEEPSDVSSEVPAGVVSDVSFDVTEENEGVESESKAGVTWWSILAGAFALLLPVGVIGWFVTNKQKKKILEESK